MFGYVKVDLPNLYVKDVILYKACYCGLCKSIGKTCGLRGRLLLNYDLTFLSVFAHNVLGVDTNIERRHCVIHPLTKRPIAAYDDLTARIARLTVILAYYKLSDDIIDDKKGRFKRAAFKKVYKKAVKSEPKLNEIVKKSYSELLNVEKQNVTSVDIVSDPFGNMMKDTVSEILGDAFTDNIANFAYNLGKWIYLIDAVDDFEKDLKKKNFNVFINLYREVDTKERLLKEKAEELKEIFGSVISGICECAAKIKYLFNHDLTDNVIYKGIFNQTKCILEGKVCKNIIKY